MIQSAAFTDLDGHTLYGLLALREAVFVVEQECAYLDLDGRDTEPTTQHLWVSVDGAPVATVRLLDDGIAADGAPVWRIGRVATAAAHRGHGYASALIDEALRRIGHHRVEIGAQAYLAEWYARFGFVRSGPDYVEDGIVHLPMRREAGVGPTMGQA